MPVDVLLVENHGALRRNLRTLLERAPGIRVVAEAIDGMDAVAKASERMPDVVVLDMLGLGPNAIDVTRVITDRNAHVRVLCLTTYANRWFVRHMRAAGATGYVLKMQVFEKLVEAIQTVADGIFYPL